MYRLHDRGFAGFAARREDAEMTHLRRARVAALVIVAVLAVAGGFAARSFNEGGSAHSKAALRNALATPGQVGEAGEASLTAVERYWQTRLTYPTGRFKQDWVTRRHDRLKRVKAGVPKGFYRPWRGGPACIPAGQRPGGRPLSPRPGRSGRSPRRAPAAGAASRSASSRAASTRSRSTGQPNVAYLARTAEACGRRRTAAPRRPRGR